MVKDKPGKFGVCKSYLCGDIVVMPFEKMVPEITITIHINLT